jgi:hypothetical protein
MGWFFIINVGGFFIAERIAARFGFDLEEKH